MIPAMKDNKYYFSTRDLLLMAALAALGGIASTYINFIGDFFQSFLGFAGTTQWAAGLHVLWLILAVGLTRKTGAGTVTGILKGAVELFSGNTHGLLILLVDLVAGILVDLGSLPFRRKDHWTTYALAGGLASASNVFVFQLFAAVPADTITVGVIGLIALIAFVSGVIFAGILGAGLLSALRSSGVVKDQPTQAPGKTAWRVMLISAILLAGGLFGYLKISQSGGGFVSITGAVAAPYQFSPQSSPVEEQLVSLESSGAAASYRGYPLLGIVAQAEPDPTADMVLLEASDGYAFFISAEELRENPAIVLQVQGKGKNLVFNVAGPASKKAWVNGVEQVRLVRSQPLDLEIAGNVVPFYPADWISDMDSTNLELESGSAKVQGVPLGLILDSAAPNITDGQVIGVAPDGKEQSFSIQQVKDDLGIRIFLNLTQGSVSYVLANLDGEVYLPALERIQIP